MYSFESPDDLDGFAVNGALSTVTLNTDTNFVSEGVQSLKWELMDLASFEGALTSNIDTGILNDPPGVDFIRFDFINTNRFVPEEPVPGTDPTFASVSVNVFGEFASNPGVTENIQFFVSEVPVGNLEPGTHQIDIDVTDGGLLVGTSTVQGFNDYIADGLTVFDFQIYLNKSFGISDPAFAWTVYIDDIRAGRNLAPAAGDHNSDGLVDAADYALWRSDPASYGGDPQGYIDWVNNFGAMAGSGGIIAAAVPEPSSALLVVVFGVGWCIRIRVRR